MSTFILISVGNFFSATTTKLNKRCVNNKFQTFFYINCIINFKTNLIKLNYYFINYKEICKVLFL